MENQVTVRVIKNNEKKLKIVILILLGLIIILSVFIFFFKKTDNTLEKLYKSELKRLELQRDSLNKNQQVLEDRLNKNEAQYQKLKFNDSLFSVQVNNYSNQLKNIKKGYEKISNYNNVSVDSLRRIFANEFK